MSRRRELLTWGGLALAGLVLLGGVLAWQSGQLGGRWATVVPASPMEGAMVFREKGCAHCHGDNAEGTQIGPALRRRAGDSLPQLVTAMWNHAPSMWNSIQSEKIRYPELSYEEMAQLIGFLYISNHTDDPGNADRGRQLFQSKGCGQCHTLDGTGNKRGPDLAKLANVDTPLEWTQALWNHAARMQSEMKTSGEAWPQFQSDELNDLFAYVQQSAGKKPSNEVSAGDPALGWEVFQRKTCINCHALRTEPAKAGPNLGAGKPLPPTFSQFGAMMLNHFPQMHAAVQKQKGNVPRFDDHEMSDLAAFLYSLHYLEPVGSPEMGGSVFIWRGCSSCHGTAGEGTRSGPPLRGIGHTYTATRLAADMWRHGSKMYAESEKRHEAWPTLQESDIGDLLAFLNSPVEAKH